jgi:hypothetical protein
VSDVMTAVPGIERQLLIEGHDPLLGMAERAVEGCRRKGSDAGHPSGMQVCEEVEREANGTRHAGAIVRLIRRLWPSRSDA